jgi:small subunit ribosomal protein S4
MARDTSPQCKQCRREGEKLFLKGERCLTDKCSVERRAYPPGDHGRGRQKQSEYRVQLREKQKARRYYGVLETQFRLYYDRASRQDGITGENLLQMLERRLDNVIVRLGYAGSRRQARQMVRHGHWTVNGRRVDIPSFQVHEGDIIALKSGSPAEPVVRGATELTAQVPAWLQADHESLTAKILRAPERREITTPVQEQLIVELYSK